MSTDVRADKKGEIVDEIVQALAFYECDHPQVDVKVYRLNDNSVRIRVIDSGFAGVGRVARYEGLSAYLNKISEEAQCDISMLLLLAPEEKEDSASNWKFEHPEEFGRP